MIVKSLITTDDQYSSNGDAKNKTHLHGEDLRTYPDRPESGKSIPTEKYVKGRAPVQEDGLDARVHESREEARPETSISRLGANDGRWELR